MLRPFLMLAVLYFVFSVVVGFNIPNYILTLLLGIILWNFFSDTTLTSMNNLIHKRELVRKIHFPISTIVISACGQCFIVLVINLSIFFLLLSFFQIPFAWQQLLLPWVVVNFFLFSLGISLIVAALSVPYQDVYHIWEVVLQIGFWVTPVLYPMDVIPTQYRFFYWFNPVARMIHEARTVLLLKNSDINQLVVTFLISVFMVFIGWILFQKLESRIIEEI